MAWQFDFEKAFRSERLERPIYIETPASVLSRSEYGRRVFRLSKSLYGLEDTGI